LSQLKGRFNLNLSSEPNLRLGFATMQLATYLSLSQLRHYPLLEPSSGHKAVLTSPRSHTCIRCFQLMYTLPEYSPFTVSHLAAGIDFCLRCASVPPTCKAWLRKELTATTLRTCVLMSWLPRSLVCPPCVLDHVL
jgi:hypothetical protein